MKRPLAFPAQKSLPESTTVVVVCALGVVGEVAAGVCFVVLTGGCVVTGGGSGKSIKKINKYYRLLKVLLVKGR